MYIKISVLNVYVCASCMSVSLCVYLYIILYHVQLGTSPLHWAAQNNHVDTVEVLLRAGISRDVRNKVERTPLHVAAQEGNIRIVNLLLQHGADVDCKDMVRYSIQKQASFLDKINKYS